MAESFAESTFLPACRKQLERLARWAYLGRLEHFSGHHVACMIRRLAPVLAEESDVEVMRAFGVLCVDVLIVESLAAGELPDCAMVGEAEIEAARLRVDRTLAALVPGEAL